MPTIPSGMKPVVQGYSIGAPDGVMRSEVGGGLARYAMQWDRGVQQYRVTLILSAVQFSVWTTFFHHIIKKGALAFDMDLNSGYGMQPHNVSILPGSYSATPTGGGQYVLWTVTFIVEAESTAYSMSTADAEAMLALYELEGDQSSALLARISQFANQDTLVLQ